MDHLELLYKLDDQRPHFELKRHQPTIIGWHSGKKETVYFL